MMLDYLKYLAKFVTLTTLLEKKNQSQGGQRFCQIAGDIIYDAW